LTKEKEGRRKNNMEIQKMSTTEEEKREPRVQYKKRSLEGKSNVTVPTQPLQKTTTEDQGTQDSSDSPLTPIEQSLRSAWKNVIIDRKKAKVFLTVGANVPWKNGQAIDDVNFLLKVLNRELFNHDYGRDPQVGLTGMCICEPHMKGKGFHGQLHFHILLDDNPALKDVDEFKKLVYKQMLRVKRNGLRIFTKKTVDVQEIEDIEELADYLTKTVRLRRWKRMENLCFVTPKGLDGVGVSYQGNEKNY
jgi:hypothetical protein